MATEDLKALGLRTPGQRQRMLNRLERDEQRTLASWLKLRKEDGALNYNWSATHRKSTNRAGLPDFQLWAKGRALLGEMKISGGRLSPEQVQMVEDFARSGTEVQVWHTAADAIEAIRDWLISMQ